MLSLGVILPLHAEEPPEEADAQLVLTFIEKYLPSIQQDLKTVASTDGEFYEEIIERLFEPASDQDVAMQHYPQQFAQEAKILEGEVQCEILAWKYQLAPTTEEKLAIQKSIEELVASQFERKLKRDQSEVQELDVELTRLKELIQQRQANRDVIIQRRIKDLTGERDGLEW